jgi:putative transcriptional regulator
MKNWIRVERAKREMTQDDLAREMGVSRDAISAIETGRYEANVGFAMKIAKFFNKRVEDLWFPTKEDIPKD